MNGKPLGLLKAYVVTSTALLGYNLYICLVQMHEYLPYQK